MLMIRNYSVFYSRDEDTPLKKLFVVNLDARKAVTAVRANNREKSKHVTSK
jgi:hypothetical protein